MYTLENLKKFKIPTAEQKRINGENNPNDPSEYMDCSEFSIGTLCCTHCSGGNSCFWVD